MASGNQYLRWLELGGDFFEEIVGAIYKAHVRLGDLVVDVGANHGRHTFPLAECVGPSGRVIAIEALPHLAANLVEFARGAKQVRVIEKAMSDGEGQTDFNWVKGDEGFSGICERRMPPELAEDVAILHVRKSTIDKSVKRPRWLFRKRLSFIKMDIEGGEYHALKGARRTITEEKPIVVFENGGPSAAQSYSYTEDLFFELFEDLHCDVFDIFGRQLTRQAWNAPETPWYAVAVAKGTEDVVFIRDRLPDMIERIESGFSKSPEPQDLN